MPESLTVVIESKVNRVAVANAVEAMDVKVIAAEVLRKTLTLAQRQARLRKQKTMTSENINDVLRKVTAAIEAERSALVTRFAG